MLLCLNRNPGAIRRPSQLYTGQNWPAISPHSSSSGYKRIGDKEILLHWDVMIMSSPMGIEPPDDGEGNLFKGDCPDWGRGETDHMSGRQ